VSQVVAHPGLILAAAKRFEQGEQTLEHLGAEPFGEFLLDPASAGPLRGEVVTKPAKVGLPGPVIQVFQLGTDSGQRIQALPVSVGIRLTQVSSTASNVAGLGARC